MLDRKRTRSASVSEDNAVRLTLISLSWPTSLYQRMREDLRQYLEKQASLDDIPICEQEPANVVSEVVSMGSSQIKVHFPDSSPRKMVVFLHFPGGEHKVA